jgi:energy-coupling factor transport system ATP-binding protein
LKIISISNLSFYYFETDNENKETKFTALDNINLNLDKGQFVAILGHNGSGKSTFAKHLNALLLPSSGDVVVNGYNTKDTTKLWDIRKCTGMVFQNPDNQLVATIVEDDVAFGLENLGLPPDEIRSRVDTSLKSVNMYEFKDTPPHFLSGGQKQRVAIAGILAMQPDIIVFDEPTAMLDPIGRLEVINSAINLNKNHGITIILITHFMEEATLADRVIVMDNGTVAIDDIPKNVFSQVDKMQALGLDVPQVTKLSHNLNSLGISIPKNILTVEEMVEALCLLK